MRFLYDFEMITQEQNKKRTLQSLEWFECFIKRIRKGVVFDWFLESSRNQSILRFDVILYSAIWLDNRMMLFFFSFSFYGFLWWDWRQALPDKTTDKHSGNNFQGHVKIALYTMWTIIYVKPIRYKHNVVINVLPVLDSNNTNDEIVSQAEFCRARHCQQDF